MEVDLSTHCKEKNKFSLDKNSFRRKFVAVEVEIKY